MKHPPAKRRPLLADIILADKHPPLPERAAWIEDFKLKLQIAKRFVLDEQAASYLGKVMHDNPRIIADAQDFAIPPFQWMWIELPTKALYVNLLGPHHDDYFNKDGLLDTMGFLLDGPRVRMAFSGVKDGERLWVYLPVEYILHMPMTVEEQIKVAQSMNLSRLALDIFFWGELAGAFTGQDVIREGDDDSEWDRASLRALRENHTMRPAAGWFKDMDPKVLHATLEGATGTLRDIVALLLFLNRTRDIQYVRDFPHTQGFIEKKLRPLVAHSVISLSMNPADRFVTLSAGEGVKRRLHDVRGHFCHDKKARSGCLHGEQLMHDFGDWWEEYAPLKWKCKGCGGLRWWRREHKRGHHEDGLVFQRYEVTV